MATTGQDLLNASQKLIDSEGVQAAAARAAQDADTAVESALAAQKTAHDNHDAARAQVKTDRENLQKVASDFSDEDETT